MVRTFSARRTTVRIDVLFTAMVVAASVGGNVAAGALPGAPDGPAAAPAGTPRAIVENRGQVAADALFYAHGTRAAVYFTPTAVVLDLYDLSAHRTDDTAPARRPAASRRRGCAVWLRFAAAEAAPSVAPSGRQASERHYFLGADPAAWRSRVPVWSEVVYSGLWPGIELRFQLFDDRLSYRVVAAPGADPGQVRFAYAGAEPIARENGDAELLETPDGLLTVARGTAGPQTGAVFWTDVPSAPARDDRDQNNPAMLLWSTFLGDAESDKGVGLTLDADGYPLVTGRTRSVLFPTTPGSYDTVHAGINDVFVAKLDPTGSTLLWSTLLGGPYDDAGLAIALDASGNPVVAGVAGSPGFPTTPGAFDETGGGARDAFVAKFDATGANLLWSTLLGGGLEDAINRVLIDSAGCPVVVGLTASPEFPSTPGAFDTMHNGGFDAFAGRLAADGSDLLACTFLGGTGHDVGLNLGLDLAGLALVTGETGSPAFPTTPDAYARSLAGETDAFVAKLDMTAATLIWSTLLGGGGADAAGPAVVDEAGDVVVTGSTESADFPTTPGVFDPSYNGLRDCFVAKLHGDGDQLLWSGFLGGDDRDKGQALVLDEVGDAVVLGYSHSADFPTTPEAYDRTHNGSFDVFVAKIAGTGNDLLGATYLGGAGRDETYAAAIDGAGDLYLIGMASAADFPTTPGAFDESYGGASDAFVAKIDLTLMTPAAIGGTGPVPYRWSSYPNPFNPATTIVFSLPAAGAVSLAIHDLRGRRVRDLRHGNLAAGRHTVRWDGRDETGRAVAAGVYLVRLQTVQGARVQKVTLVQ